MIAQTVQIVTERTQQWVPPAWWLPTIITASLLVCGLNIWRVYRKSKGHNYVGRAHVCGQCQNKHHHPIHYP